MWMVVTNKNAVELLKVLNNFFESHDISWNDYVDICSDGPRAKMGKSAGALARTKAAVWNCTSNIFFTVSVI